MSAVTAAPVRQVSPRTARRPMAFTAGEFIRGALVAFGWFYALYVPAVGLLTLMSALVDSPAGPASDPSRLLALAEVIPLSIIGLVWAAPASLVALATYGGGAALLVGLALRTSRRVWVHLTLYALIGVAVGAATPLLTFRIVSTGLFPSATSDLELAIPFALSTGAAVVLGWLSGMKDARRELRARAAEEARVEAPTAPVRRDESSDASPTTR